MSDYVYKKLGTLNEPEFKVNAFGIISNIVKLHKPTVSGKFHTQIHIADDTCRDDFVLHIYCTKGEDLPKELQIYKIIRVHRMKVERYNDKLDGRVFKGQDIVVFEPDENSNAFYSTAKVVTVTDSDKRRLNQLRKWMKESYRFRCAFQVKDYKLCEIKGEKVFNLFCKLTNIRTFSDYETLVLTVVDATKCPELVYKVPDNWSGSELPEDFHRDVSEVDIIFYKGGDYYQTIQIGHFCQLWNVKSVECNVNFTNGAVGYKLIMLKNEGSIFTVPYRTGKTIALQRMLERGFREDFASDSEIEMSLQNNMKSFILSSSEESANEAEQEDNLRNSTSAQRNYDNKPLATDLKPSASQTHIRQSEVKLTTNNHDVSVSSNSIKTGSIDLEQLFKHSTSEQNICEMQPLEEDLSGSDTDIEVLEVVSSPSKINTISLSNEFSRIGEYKSEKGLSSLNNLKVVHVPSDWCSKNVGTKRKLTDEMIMTSKSVICTNKRSNQAEFSKTATNSEGNESVTSPTSNKNEFVAHYKTLEIWKNSFPNLFTVEKIEPGSSEMTNKGIEINSTMDRLQGIDVFLVDVRPSLDDDAMDLISGYCHSGCYEMFLHSTLMKDNRNKTYLCPACNKQGLKREVELMLLVELMVMNTSGVYMNVVACGKQAEKFFGCSVEEYMCNVELRSSIVKTLLLHSVYKSIRMGCKKVPIINLHVGFQENKYFVIDTKL